jgi:hypothetical protein
VTAQTAANAFALAGIAPRDIDCIELHDGTSPAELIYYEDYPYAEQPERLTHVWGSNEWASESIGLSADALYAKIEAFLQHRSQISTFYRDDEEVAQRMRAYAELVGQGQPAERYWRQI